MIIYISFALTCKIALDPKFANLPISMDILYFQLYVSLVGTHFAREHKSCGSEFSIIVGSGSSVYREGERGETREREREIKLVTIMQVGSGSGIL